ncbi:TetR family transcriptional regulator [Pullulanibacillus pueri]|uniref:TetR family transcriptional regulator n=1 Tax=Pullulanibacillus pueri TaxID=1437324 RepID=UPI001E31A2C6|nr:TetR family transcriptional regulator [Pullulanibacillus pueri]
MTQEHIQKRKDEILDAAERVFKRKGFEPTTMKDVVEETQMSRGGVYQYFSNTENMFEAIHDRHLKQLPHQLEHLLDQNGTVWEALLTYLHHYYIDNTSQYDVRFGMVAYEYSVTSWRNERHRRFMLNKSQESITAFTDFLQKGVDRGEFSPLQPLKTITFFMFNITDGLMLHASIDDDTSVINGQLEGLKLYLQTALGVNAKDV